ncbi:hypothetical protein K439DRAFT_1385698 [Ramaria rubella]|nr:hypothetical protein K439DRAFT_1385698 [Ramaria rubella]
MPPIQAISTATILASRAAMVQAQVSLRNLTREEPFWRAEEDLRRYLASARLPSISRHDKSNPYCLPAKGRRSHRNKLRVRHNADRNLQRIRRQKALDKATQTYHKDYIYGEGGRPYAGKHYKLRPESEALVLTASYCTSEDTFENIPYPNNLDMTCQWLLERPFKTMQRAMHLAFPDTTRWWLDPAEPTSQPDDDANSELWRSYVWRFHPDEFHRTWWRDVSDLEGGAPTTTEPAPSESMVFVVQAPWILALQDMQHVSECENFPPLNNDVPLERQLSSHQRVWAKLHDTCRQQNCRKFVFTTYHGWMFGSFSDDWSSAHISEVKDFDAHAPSVMQTLVYWVASSMGLAGTTEHLQEVGGEVVAV